MSSACDCYLSVETFWEENDATLRVNTTENYCVRKETNARQIANVWQLKTWTCCTYRCSIFSCHDQACHTMFNALMTLWESRRKRHTRNRWSATVRKDDLDWAKLLITFCTWLVTSTNVLKYLLSDVWNIEHCTLVLNISFATVGMTSLFFITFRAAASASAAVSLARRCSRSPSPLSLDASSSRSLANSFRLSPNCDLAALYSASRLRAACLVRDSSAFSLSSSAFRRSSSSV